MKRLLLLLLVGLLTLPAFARKTKSYDGFDIYGIEEPVKKSLFGVELGFGNAFELGVRYQLNFGKYFAWDVLQFRYAKRFDPFTNKGKGKHKISITMGARGFTPGFGPGKNMKIFLSAGLGYGAVSKAYHHQFMGALAIDASLGLQYKKFHIAYGQNMIPKTAHRWGKLVVFDHSFRVGFDF